MRFFRIPEFLGRESENLKTQRKNREVLRTSPGQFSAPREVLISSLGSFFSALRPLRMKWSKQEKILRWRVSGGEKNFFSRKGALSGRMSRRHVLGVSWHHEKLRYRAWNC